MIHRTIDVIFVRTNVMCLSFVDSERLYGTILGVSMSANGGEVLVSHRG